MIIMYMVPHHAHFLDDFDDSFRNLFNGLDFRPQFKNLMSTDVIETEDGLNLTMELPGVDKECINIELNEGYLTITASMNKSSEETKNNGKYIRKERHSGNYKRSFYVGENITSEDIKAKFKNGILSVSFPKNDEKEESKKKIIDIE